MNKIQVTRPKNSAASEPTLTTDRRELQQSVGLLDGWAQRGRESKRAAHALDTLNDAMVQARVKVQLTNLHMTETTICQAIVAGGLDRMGALAVQVNQQASAVTQLLSSSFAADLVSTLRNRSDSQALIDDHARQGVVSAEESAAVKDVFTKIATDDIARASKRMDDAKAAVDALAEHATRGIEKSRERLP